MADLGSFSLGGLIGLVIGFSLWFPYKWYLKKAVTRKREAVSVLVELGRNEHEMAREQMQQTWKAHTGSGYSTTTSPFSPTWASYGGTSQGLPTATGRWTPTYASATTTAADAHTHYTYLES